MPVAPSRGDALLAELPDEAVIRITVAQTKAVLGELMQASKYATPQQLAEAIAVAVVTANDDKTKYVVIAKEPKEIWVYGPYASFATAAKTAASGHCAHSTETRVVIRPLVSSPKSTAPKRPDPSPKKPAKKKESDRAVD